MEHLAKNLLASLENEKKSTAAAACCDCKFGPPGFIFLFIWGEGLQRIVIPYLSSPKLYFYLVLLLISLAVVFCLQILLSLLFCLVFLLVWNIFGI